MSEITLLENQTTNGSGTEETWTGGTGTLCWDGVFDGATVTLETAGFTDANFEPVKDGVFTTKQGQNVTFGVGTRLKATVSNAGASTDLTLRASV